MKEIITVIILIIMLAACAATTTITDPEGRQYEIVSRPDALVHAKLSNGIDLTVDNRGKPSLFDSVMQFMLLDELNDNKGD